MFAERMRQKITPLRLGRLGLAHYLRHPGLAQALEEPLVVGHPRRIVG